MSSIPESSRPLLAALDGNELDKARQTVRRFSLAAAGIVIMPTPFAHLVLLIPVQSAMVIKIARIFGTQDPPEKILAYIAATSGVSVFGQVSALILSSLVPIVGGLVSAPFIYGWTYGLGEVAIRYFQAQGEMSDEEMQAVFKEASKQGQKMYKKEKKLSKQESLEELRGHLSPDEYERLKSKFS